MKKVFGFVSFISVVLLSLVTTFADTNEPSSVLIAFPLTENMAVPVWMNNPQVTTNANGDQQLRIAILPQSTDEALMLTACFQEQSGTKIQVEWVDANGTVTLLSNDLAEAIGIANQRSLLISSATMGTGGTLVITGEPLLNRIKLEWLKPGDSLVADGEPSLLVAPSAQSPVASSEVSGETQSVTQNQWKDKLVETTFVNEPERADAPVEYPMELEALPDLARLKLKENGLPFGQHLVVWINQQRAGNIQPDVPDLNNPGYVDATHFVGWREGTLLLPRALFKVGENDLQFSTESDDTTQDPSLPPFAVRNVTIQFLYPNSDNSNSSSSVLDSSANVTAPTPTPEPTSEPTSSTQPDPLSPGSTSSNQAGQ